MYFTADAKTFSGYVIRGWALPEFVSRLFADRFLAPDVSCNSKRSNENLYILVLIYMYRLSSVAPFPCLPSYC